MRERTFRTRLANERWVRSITQQRMSEKTGIPLRTYRRLEAGEIDNPPIRYLVNCAIALNVALEEVCEDAWLSWTRFDASARGSKKRVRLTNDAG